MNNNPIRLLSQWGARHYSAPLVFVLFSASIVFLWMFNVSSLPLSNPELVKISGREGLLDLMVFYSAEEAYAALGHYGPTGRALYYRFLAADFVFIPIYSFGLVLLMTRNVQVVCNDSQAWLWLNVLPFGIGFFDCIENLSIFGMLGHYPGYSLALGTLAGVSTLCKYALTVLVLSMLAYGGVVLLGRKLIAPGIKRR